MSAIWDVFVEGPSDKVFLKCLLRHLGISHVHTSVIYGGVSHLHKVKNVIQKSHDSGKRIAIVLDADSKPENRRVEFRKKRDELKLPIADEYCFLMPNDQDSGDLETLLEWISVREHRAVYDCFKQYESCLRNRSYPVPDGKERIYAYCAAVKAKVKPNERNYCDPKHWNLNASAVEPLRQFLFSLPR